MSMSTSVAASTHRRTTRGVSPFTSVVTSNLRDSTTAEALQVICDSDLADLQAVEPPRGFGRD